MMKKIFALVLAVVMVLAMGATAFAADGDLVTDGIVGNFTQADTTNYNGNAVILYKEITAYNKDGKSVNAPTIDYYYTITGLAGGTSVKDAGGTDLHATGNAVEVTTKDASSITATIAGSKNGTDYENGKLALDPTVSLNASENGTANKFNLKVTFTESAFTSAGVYRFKIEETTDEATKNSAGIKEGSGENTLYLDVYVKDKDATTAGQYIYGYVLFTNNVAIDGTDATAAGKVEGFVDTNSSETNSTADEYFTFNLKVSKTLEGDSFSNDHDFPFHVNFKNSSVTSAIVIKTESSENGAVATAGSLPSGTLSAAETGIAATPGIDHQSYVTYVGVPVGITAATTAEVYENNDVTGTTYVSKYKIDDAAEAGTKSINWTGDTSKSNVATLTSITMNAKDNVSHVIGFTNSLEIISPTGVALRIAPYVGMLVAGIALIVVVVVKRRKNEEEAEA